MVHQQVAFANSVENVATVSERGGNHRRVNRIVQLRNLDTRQRHQVTQFEQLIDIVHVTFAERRNRLCLACAELLEQQLSHRGRHLAVNLQPHDLSKSPLKNLLLDRLEQILRLIDLPEIEIRVSRDAERMPARDRHTGKQRAKILADHILERDE